MDLQRGEVHLARIISEPGLDLRAPRSEERREGEKEKERETEREQNYPSVSKSLMDDSKLENKLKSSMSALLSRQRHTTLRTETNMETRKRD